MAKLSARGRRELARFEYASKRIARMSDGVLLIDHGTGWSVYGRVKAGVDPVQSARDAQVKYNARPVEFVWSTMEDWFKCGQRREGGDNGMSTSLPVWRIFNYLAKTWYDLPTSKLDEFADWYPKAIDFVWNLANAQEIERRKAAA